MTVPSDRTDAVRDSSTAVFVDRDAGITVEAVDAAVSASAEHAEEAAPGDGSDAVVREQVVRTTAADSSLSVSYLAFLTIVTLLAAVAIVNDSAIVVVGAMVLGPGTVAGLSGRSQA